MKSNKSGSLFLVLLLLGTAAAVSANGCVANTDEPGTAVDTIAPSGPEVTGDNVMSVTVNGSLCGNNPNAQYANEPCVSVKICPAGSSDPSLCQTIDNVLLDTGSYGLRLFKPLVTVDVQTTSVVGGELAECVQFGDGSSQWGQVATVGLQLANQPIIQVPIMLIDSTYATAPGPCSAAQSVPDTSPLQAGFNGILGVGLFANDCGTSCATDPYNGEYYSCTGAGCVPALALAEQQVQNPISLLPRDNNGLILKLPSVTAGGAASLEGQLLLGIGTQSNNQPGTVEVYGADENANFTTVFAEYSASPITSFIDSGSSVLFFPPPAAGSSSSSGGSLPDCNSVSGGSHGTSYAGFYCPSSTQNFSATNISATSSISGSMPFEVSNAFALFSTKNKVFATMADSSPVGSSAVFDWGLPFFYGKDVYVGIDGKNKVIGGKTYTGPIWAY